MNTMGPVEAKAKAYVKTIRGKFFPQIKPVVRKTKRAAPEPKPAPTTLVFKRMDVINCSATPVLPTRRSQAEQIVGEVAVKYCVGVSEIRSGCTARQLVRARQEAMYRLRTELDGLSLPRIGELLGGRHHTTVLHGIRRHRALIEAPV